MGAIAPAVSTAPSKPTVVLQKLTLTQQAWTRFYTCHNMMCGKQVNADQAYLPSVPRLYKLTGVCTKYPLTIAAIADHTVCRSCKDMLSDRNTPLLYVVKAMQKVAEDNAREIIEVADAEPVNTETQPQHAKKAAHVVTRPCRLLTCSGCGKSIAENIALLPDVEVLYDTLYHGLSIAPPLTPEQVDGQVICDWCAGTTVKTFSYSDTASLMDRLRAKGLKWARKVPGRKATREQASSPKPQQTQGVAVISTSHERPRGPAQVRWWEKNTGPKEGGGRPATRSKGGNQQGKGNNKSRRK